VIAHNNRTLKPTCIIRVGRQLRALLQEPLLIAGVSMRRVQEVAEMGLRMFFCRDCGFSTLPTVKAAFKDERSVLGSLFCQARSSALLLNKIDGGRNDLQRLINAVLFQARMVRLFIGWQCLGSVRQRLFIVA